MTRDADIDCTKTAKLQKVFDRSLSWSSCLVWRCTEWTSGVGHPTSWSTTRTASLHHFSLVLPLFSYIATISSWRPPRLFCPKSEIGHSTVSCHGVDGCTSVVRKTIRRYPPQSISQLPPLPRYNFAAKQETVELPTEAPLVLSA